MAHEMLSFVLSSNSGSDQTATPQLTAAARCVLLLQCILLLDRDVIFVMPVLVISGFRIFRAQYICMSNVHLVLTIWGMQCMESVTKGTPVIVWQFHHHDQCPVLVPLSDGRMTLSM
jgi:hypothetical protein